MPLLGEGLSAPERPAADEVEEMVVVSLLPVVSATVVVR